MTKNKKNNHQNINTPMSETPSHTAPGDSVAQTAKLMGGGLILAAIICAILLFLVVTQKKQPIILPANLQQSTPANGPDAFGRQPGHEHYGHTHP